MVETTMMPIRWAHAKCQAASRRHTVWRPQVAGRNGIARLADFRAWMGSDLLHNAFRGRLAEFMVSRALGCKAETRPGWDEFDLLTAERAPVEVKSAAYLQSWERTPPSAIQFSIRPASPRGDDARRERGLKRHSRVYAFALFDHGDRPTVKPLDVIQWTLYALGTDRLDNDCPGQKKISLRALVALGRAL